MRKSIRDTKKSKAKIGRPKTTGTGQPQVVRMHDQQIAEIDAWIARQGQEMSRPDAIRRLVEIGLGGGNSARQRSANSAERAKQLAAKTIDGLVDPASEEAVSRKRRLLKGPEEFREVRVDYYGEKPLVE
jgi:hypothetical protein